MGNFLKFLLIPLGVLCLAGVNEAATGGTTGFKSFSERMRKKPVRGRKPVLKRKARSKSQNRTQNRRRIGKPVLKRKARGKLSPYKQPTEPIIKTGAQHQIIEPKERTPETTEQASNTNKRQAESERKEKERFEQGRQAADQAVAEADRRRQEAEKRQRQAEQAEVDRLQRQEAAEEADRQRKQLTKLENERLQRQEAVEEAERLRRLEEELQPREQGRQTGEQAENERLQRQAEAEQRRRLEQARQEAERRAEEHRAAESARLRRLEAERQLEAEPQRQAAEAERLRRLEEELQPREQGRQTGEQAENERLQRQAEAEQRRRLEQARQEAERRAEEHRAAESARLRRLEAERQLEAEPQRQAAAETERLTTKIRDNGIDINFIGEARIEKMYNAIKRELSNHHPEQTYDETVDHLIRLLKAAPSLNIGFSDHQNDWNSFVHRELNTIRESKLLQDRYPNIEGNVTLLFDFVLNYSNYSTTHDIGQEKKSQLKEVAYHMLWAGEKNLALPERIDNLMDHRGSVETLLFEAKQEIDAIKNALPLAFNEAANVRIFKSKVIKIDPTHGLDNRGIHTLYLEVPEQFRGDLERVREALQRRRDLQLAAANRQGPIGAFNEDLQVRALQAQLSNKGINFMDETHTRLMYRAIKSQLLSRPELLTHPAQTYNETVDYLMTLIKSLRNVNPSNEQNKWNDFITTELVTIAESKRLEAQYGDRVKNVAHVFNFVLNHTDNTLSSHGVEIAQYDKLKKVAYHMLVAGEANLDLPANLDNFSNHKQSVLRLFYRFIDEINTLNRNPRIASTTFEEACDVRIFKWQLTQLPDAANRMHGLVDDREIYTLYREFQREYQGNFDRIDDAIQRRRERQALELQQRLEAERQARIQKSIDLKQTIHDEIIGLTNLSTLDTGVYLNNLVVGEGNNEERISLKLGWLERLDTSIKLWKKEGLLLGGRPISVDGVKAELRSFQQAVDRSLNDELSPLDLDGDGNMVGSIKFNPWTFNSAALDELRKKLGVQEGDPAPLSEAEYNTYIAAIDRLAGTFTNLKARSIIKLKDLIDHEDANHLPPIGNESQATVWFRNNNVQELAPYLGTEATLKTLLRNAQRDMLNIHTLNRNDQATEHDRLLAQGNRRIARRVLKIYGHMFTSGGALAIPEAKAAEILTFFAIGGRHCDTRADKDTRMIMQKLFGTAPLNFEEKVFKLLNDLKGTVIEEIAETTVVERIREEGTNNYIYYLSNREPNEPLAQQSHVVSWIEKILDPYIGSLSDARNFYDRYGVGYANYYDKIPITTLLNEFFGRLTPDRFAGILAAEIRKLYSQDPSSYIKSEEFRAYELFLIPEGSEPPQHSLEYRRVIFEEFDEEGMFPVFNTKQGLALMGSLGLLNMRRNNVENDVL